ncbi:MAG TPA: 30S ribosomal protein S2 [Candidatus Paceibacterota bacterium]|nr:30S ribosomal protein S2 [Candidatus Paceibacterota bacterium]
MAEEQVPVLKPEELYPDEGFREMVEAGVFYGRKKNRTNPKMRSNILLNRNGIEIIHLGKTADQLEKAVAFLTETAKIGGNILFVATQPAAEEVATLAKELGYPVVTRRWLGGTLTNFGIISKRIEYYKKLRTDWENKAFDKYTKKERVMIEKELGRLNELMSGLEALTAKPAAVVVIDPNMHLTAVREARLLKIPVVAFANTDSDPAILDYPVVGNNKARTSIHWFLEKVRAAVVEGVKMRVVIAPKEEKSEQVPPKRSEK